MFILFGYDREGLALIRRFDEMEELLSFVKENNFSEYIEYYRVFKEIK